MKSIIENKLRLLVVVIVTLPSFVSAQPSPHVGSASGTHRDESCETLIAERFDRVGKRGSKKPKSLSIPLVQKLISPELSTLLKDVHLQSLYAYRFKGPQKTALVLHTLRVGRALSENSIQDWFVQVGKYAATFRSIATNPNLLFWDKEGKLNYLTLLYSEGAAFDSSSKSISLDFRRLRLTDSGITELIEEEKNLRCVLRVPLPI